MTLSLIVAIADNGIIGKGGKLPWHLPAELQYFKRTTMGHPIIMGRKTFESIGRPLPGRRNIVITRNPKFYADGIDIVTSVDEAIACARDEDKEPMIIGGCQIYEASVHKADRIYLTEVHFEPEGDARFSFDRSGWKEVSRIFNDAEGTNPAYSYVILDRE